MNVEDAINFLDLPVQDVVLYAETKNKDFYIDGDKMKIIFIERSKK